MISISKEHIPQKNIDSYLHDLNRTLNINLKVISKIDTSSKITPQQMIILNEKIKKILEMQNNYQKMKKAKSKIKGELLLNNQLFDEINRTKRENENMLSAKIEEINNSIFKKNISIKKFRKKFEEVEIFVRRECKSYPKYKNLYSLFSMSNFMEENDNLYKQHDKILKEKNNILTNLTKIKSENKIYKKNRKIFCIKENNNYVYENIDEVIEKIDIQKEKNKYENKYLNKLKNIYSKTIYEPNLIYKNDSSCEESDENFNYLNDISEIQSGNYNKITEDNLSEKDEYKNDSFCNNIENRKNGIGDDDFDDINKNIDENWNISQIDKKIKF